MRMNEKPIGLLLILAGGACLLLGWRSYAPTSPPMAVVSRQEHTGPELAVDSANSSPWQSCKVLTVYDGDTLGCDMDADGVITRPQEEVRLLGIDSPEMHYSRKNPTYGTEHPVDEPFAKAASQWMERQVAHKTVYLEFDQRRADRYGRALAFVYLKPGDTISLNEQELSQGLAMLLFLGKNRLHEAQFQAVEANVRQSGLGLWASPQAATGPASRPVAQTGVPADRATSPPH